MVEHLLLLNPDEEIMIIDNDSTYLPLLNWYKTVKNRIDIRYGTNDGHRAVWVRGIHKELLNYFVYTDSDIHLNENLPKDYKSVMNTFMQKYDMDKCGLAISIDDIPDHYALKEQIIRNESRWWLDEPEEDVFIADTDTTFCMIKNIGDNMYSSVRIGRKDFICKHTPWYLDLNNLSEEEKFIYENHNPHFLTQYTKQHVAIYKNKTI